MQETKHTDFVDPLLEHWLTIVEQDDIELEIVLQCSGIIVAGTLIAHTAFMKIHYDLMAKVEPEEREGLDKSLDYLTRHQKHEAATMKVRVLSFKEVSIVEGGTRYQSKLWRVKAESVSGWYFGALPDTT